MDRVQRVGVPTGDDVLRLLPALADALSGSGPALLPVPPGPTAGPLLAAARVDEPVAEGTALLLATSGSTGAPKVVELGADALRASAVATTTALGGPARWLLALPVAHVAGWQVLVRSVVAGTEPVVLDVSQRFTPAAFATAAGRLGHTRACTALVPTQLHRLLADPAGREALTRFAAVLVGGAATSPALLERARAAGVAVVTTYGMTETAGGCVYDGRPLDGVRVAVEDDGRVRLGGPVLARGYRGDDSATREAFTEDDDGRWFRTADAGRIDDGVLSVSGRIDDLVVTGGRKVAPAAIERVVGELPDVEACLVVGVPDAEWGQAVTALVVGAADAAAVRAHVTARLGATHAPRHVLHVAELPLLGIGKPDRAAAVDLATRALGSGG